MTFLRSSGLMDPEPSASKRLKADKTASYPGKMAGLGWGRSLNGWGDNWFGICFLREIQTTPIKIGCWYSDLNVLGWVFNAAFLRGGPTYVNECPSNFE